MAMMGEPMAADLQELLRDGLTESSGRWVHRVHLTSLYQYPPPGKNSSKFSPDYLVSSLAGRWYPKHHRQKTHEGPRPKAWEMSLGANRCLLCFGTKTATKETWYFLYIQKLLFPNYLETSRNQQESHSTLNTCPRQVKDLIHPVTQG